VLLELLEGNVIWRNLPLLSLVRLLALFWRWRWGTAGC
jgi:hypothetical protein